MVDLKKRPTKSQAKKIVKTISQINKRRDREEDDPKAGVNLTKIVKTVAKRQLENAKASVEESVSDDEDDV